MNISTEQFDQYLNEAIDSLPQETIDKLHNVAILVDDYPTNEQLEKVKKDITLFGLFEGYGQAKKTNFGVITPDRITIFRKPIMEYCDNEEEIKRQILSTLKHEIAHHFGSDEPGARKAGRIIDR